MNAEELSRLQDINAQLIEALEEIRDNAGWALTNLEEIRDSAGWALTKRAEYMDDYLVRIQHLAKETLIQIEKETQ